MGWLDLLVARPVLAASCPLQVEADDLDQGSSGQISYSMAASQPARGLFHIDPATGTITTTAILDREIWAETR